uniref:S1 RNA-binding domain-containing protein 1-like n=1 Tax=Phallusia mammillata TaxID=59560 RepID=A0A6F9DSZ3_9ASCI|nr:S1 RNA-binding domain-containing protein 1-like [Phallusia mammillata]
MESGVVKKEVLDPVEILARDFNLSYKTAEKLIKMIEKDECTVPFIARYRKEATNQMEADKLRQFVDALTQLRDVQKKAETMIKNIEKQGKLDTKLERSICQAETKEELNHLFAPFKGDRKHTLADRARTIGLEEAAHKFMDYRKSSYDFMGLVDNSVEGRKDVKQVQKGIQHLMAEIVAKDPGTLDKVKKIFPPRNMVLETKIYVPKKKEEADGVKLNEKYRIYFDFRCQLNFLKSYQILAINRAEAQKQITVKIVIPDRDEKTFLSWCERTWIKCQDASDKKLAKHSIDDAYTRLIKPLVIRRARAELTQRANLDSVEVFSRNLSKLLLTAPVRGKIVLGVDPGYRHGCKCAVVSENGDNILATDIFYLHNKNVAFSKMLRLYKTHKFQVIAIGNGTGCAEVEKFFARVICETGNPNLLYCTVNENGASIYSVTDEAKSELPNLEPNLRSAVSIARRLQDPLVELVKIDPKHIGVGMYQHDIPQSLLKAALSNVVEDCVTFVGVDLNVAGPSLLRHVAGLKPAQVKNIVEWRQKNGSFKNREQLLLVKGIGEKTFKHCAGFVRISNKQPYVSVPNEKTTVKSEADCKSLGKRKNKKDGGVSNKKQKLSMEYLPNPLDQTNIHPESYEIAEKFLQHMHCDITKIGKAEFVSQLKSSMTKQCISSLAKLFSVGEPTMQLIIDGLSQINGFRDIRESMEPLLRRGNTNDIKPGDVVRGRVANVTDFGVFVDIGIGQDALLHLSKMNGRWNELKEIIGPNDIITVSVLNTLQGKTSVRLVSADCVEKLRFV